MDIDSFCRQKKLQYIELDETQSRLIIETWRSVFDDYQLGGFHIQCSLTATYRFKEKGKIDVYAFWQEKRSSVFKISGFNFENEFDLLCFEYLMDVDFQFYLLVDKHYPDLHTLIERY